MNSMFMGRIDRDFSLQKASECKSAELRRRLRGLLFSIGVAAAPILIVLLSPPRSGGIFVAGYLVGAITAPIIVLGSLKAADDLFDSRWLNSLLGVLIYLTALVLLSVAAILWSFYMTQ